MAEKYDDRRWLRFDVAFAILTVGLFTWGLAKTLGWIGGEPLFAPMQTLILAGALALQAVSPVLGRRSTLGGRVFLVAAFALMLTFLWARGRTWN